MCGITGFITFSESQRNLIEGLERSVSALRHRGPDHQAVWTTTNVGLGHCRLSIIDLSEAGNQPMTTQNQRYTIVYNGEIYNFKALREELQRMGVQFRSQSDTEVLLYGYQVWGKEVLHRLNGFFAFAIYDRENHSLFLARDRFGIKPLYWYADDEFFAFGSELSALLNYPIPRYLDPIALLSFLQLTYIPAPLTILKGVWKLKPGHYLEVNNLVEVEPKPYYRIEERIHANVVSYREAQEQLITLLRRSVQRRLVADVPVGTYLSGGIDSSIITVLAAQESPHIEAFTVTFPENPFYDERFYAEKVAKRYRITHHLVELREKELLETLPVILNAMDEPFGDSSALAVYHISRIARQSVKVILSGDGADELFGGYWKHLGESYAVRSRLVHPFLGILHGILRFFPQHRGGWFPNKLRQLNRWIEGVRLPDRERYWRWACFTPYSEVIPLLQSEWRIPPVLKEFELWRDEWLSPFSLPDHPALDSLNRTLLCDLGLVLPNDMLKKVDAMSMLHGLEVRVPFLDHEVVEWVVSLPSRYKVKGTMRKRLLQDAFRSYLPEELYGRPKRGFEIPLKEWIQGPLRPEIEHNWLNAKFIEDQGIFNPDAIAQLKRKAFSHSPGDTITLLWCLIVFQQWWKRYFE